MDRLQIVYYSPNNAGLQPRWVAQFILESVLRFVLSHIVLPGLEKIAFVVLIFDIMTRA